MRIFLDTNFIVDLFVDRKDGFDHKKKAQELLSLSKRLGYRLFISYLTIANFNYLLRKYSKEDRTNCITTIIQLFEIVPNTKHQITEALKLDPPDFEDALQYMAAKEMKCDSIVTRDKKGFSISDIPVFTPSEFIDSL